MHCQAVGFDASREQALLQVFPLPEGGQPLPLPPGPGVRAGGSLTPYLFLSQRAPQDTDTIPIALAGEIPPCPVDEPNLHEGEQNRNGRSPLLLLPPPGLTWARLWRVGPGNPSGGGTGEASGWHFPAFQG